MIPPDFIDEVLSRIDIVEIIEPRVALKKSGQNYTGLCPFHNEKSPSFSVSQDKQFYYCFGCQASGSALKFLMEFDRMDFVSAVEYLADRVGMTVPNEKRGDAEASRKRKSLYDILQQSAAFYRDQLRHHQHREAAVNYLKGRGLSGEIARDFGLGYAPPGWDNLMAKLATTNADRQLLIDAGMLAENAEEDKTYDRFRDRIMFPIRDLRGRVIAFGGRVLSAEAKPKYLNSPETPVFHKGRELYGLFEARRRVHRLQRLIVVEGYMDVVALAQHGIGYSVATLGTATSTEHVERMFRLVSEIVFCFDGDPAGRNAAWKALQTALPAMEDGCATRFLFLPEGDDPDTYVRREGQDRFEARVSDACSLSQFFFDHLGESLDLETPEGKAALSKLAAPHIGTVPEGVFRQLLIKELAERTGLDVEKLIGASGLGTERSPRSENMPSQGRLAPTAAFSQSTLAEHAICILLRQPEVANLLDEADVRLLDGVSEWQVLVDVVRWVQGGGDVSPAVLIGHYHGTPYFEYLKDLAEKDPMLAPDRLSDEFLDTLKRMRATDETLQKRLIIDELKAKKLSELTPEEKRILAEYRRPPPEN